MTRSTRSFAWVAAAFGICAPAFGYYHFIQYLSQAGPYQPVYERFDLAALPGNTIQWFLNGSTQPALSANDSMTGVLSQIQAAAAAWNEVPGAELKLAYGGTVASRQSLSTPWIEVTFDELPPGLLAMGGPVSRGEVANGPAGAFVPIAKSLLVLSKDLTSQPSYSEAFFLRVVHEFGHALGLQHSWTSGVMSTEITRSTTKASPLGADDIAGLSILYPSRTFQQRSGGITGRVTMDGAGVHLASVVALTANGPAVSTLTLPDGAYRLEGLPNGNYYVYVHALPPPLPGEPEPANLVLPRDPNGQVNPGGFFETQFWPRSRQPQQTLPVREGATLNSIDFSVQRRDRGLTLHSVQTYSFFTDVPVKPATFWRGRQTGALVLSGYGLMGASGPASGLTVSLLGGPETIEAVFPYPPDNRFLQINLGLNTEAQEGWRHLIFSVGPETYVLPAAIRIVRQQPPSITSLAPGPDLSVLISGTELSMATRILFDGVRGVNRGYEEGVLRVALPAALKGHRAVVTALNPDGQSSFFLRADAANLVVLDQTESSPFSASLTSLPAGGEAVIELTSQDGRFESQQLFPFFGSSDIAVRRVMVLSPDRALAIVAVNPQAAAANLSLSAYLGLQLVRGPEFFLQPSAGRVMSVQMATGLPSAVQGGTATVSINQAPLFLNPSNSSVLVGEGRGPIQSLSNNQLVFTVPPGTPLGVVPLRITINGEAVLPAAIQVETPPPVITAIQTFSGEEFSSFSPARPGVLLRLLVRNLPERLTQPNQQIKIFTVLPDGSSIQHNFLQVQQLPNLPGVHVVYVVLAQVNGFTQLPVNISADGVSSAPFLVNYRP